MKKRATVSASSLGTGGAGVGAKKKPAQANTLDNYFKQPTLVVKCEVKCEEPSVKVEEESRKAVVVEEEEEEEAKLEVEREAKRVCVEQESVGLLGTIRTVSIETFKNYFKREAKPVPAPPASIKTESTEPGRKSRGRGGRGGGGSLSQADATDAVPVADPEPRTYRPCPFYKRIEETRICVDAFNFGDIANCDAYFLSHFHYDHFIGLSKSFAHQMYCSQVTANLVCSKIKVERSHVNVIEMNKFINVYDVDDRIQVKLIDANHCPGAVMFLFRLALNRSAPPKYILHTGDFRASDALVNSLKEMNVRLDCVYLDTTYCDSNYSFLPQEQVVRLGVETVRRELAAHPKALIVCGTYTIGKERVFIAIADALGKKICVSREKFNTLKCLEDAELTRKLTLDPSQTNIHVLPMGQINGRDLAAYLAKFAADYTYLVAVKPTGWTHKAEPRPGAQPGLSVEARGKNHIIYGLEYSEHSSFAELRNFVQTLRPRRIIPTVNCGNVEYRERMKAYFAAWNSS